PCTARVWLKARLRKDRRRYVLRSRARLSPGRYVVISRVTDARGNLEPETKLDPVSVGVR
ncbi:MAG: hypothetical protein H0V81_13320, partial [Solirubrobacterales bacterium]|nr:hypothetical protein [Solirubrobacterales bacterium]